MERPKNQRRNRQIDRQKSRRNDHQSHKHPYEEHQDDDHQSNKHQNNDHQNALGWIPDRLRQLVQCSVELRQKIRSRMTMGLLRGWTRRSSDDRANNDSPLGARGERLAVNYLAQKGYRILQTGFRCKSGEVDIIAKDQSTLVFVEVKTWQQSYEGGPSDAVDLGKQRRITQTALFYIQRHKLWDCPARFDVIEIVMVADRDNTTTASERAERFPGLQSDLQIRHFENAFEAVGQFQMFS